MAIDTGKPPAEAGAADERPAPESRPRRPLRKWLIRTALALLVLLIAGGVWGKIAFERIEASARQVAEAGTSLNTFLKHYVAELVEGDVDGLLALHDDDYASRSEGVWQQRLESDRDGVQVYSWHEVDARPFAKSDLREQIERHLETIGRIDEGKFKISSLENLTGDEQTVIRAVLWLRGATRDELTLESRTTFRLTLSRPGGEWRVSSKELLHGETVIGSRQGFTDVTEAAGIAFQSHHNPMLNEPEWRPDRFGIMKYASAGVSTVDYDNDGWYDIFFCDGATPCLYRNKGDGTFQDVTSAAGLPPIQAVHVAIFADLDNDGDKDLFLGRSTGNNYLFRNEGNGSFVDVSARANVSGVWVATAAAADYNNDGLIDLYLGRYLDPRTELPTTNFYTRNSEGNALLRNNGDLTFSDVTAEAGVREGGLSLGVAWGDYDQDGDQDLYVANDFGRNALFRNNADGTFSDVSKQSGTIDIGYGMSACFEDIDNDGDLDIYVAAVHSGQRWFGNTATLQRYLINSIQEGTILEDFPLYREIYSLVEGDWEHFGEDVIRGNSLMLNNGDGTFADVTEECRVNPHGWYWSSMIFDYDCDGFSDIYTVNGWVTGATKDDL